jgi:hypothetical protein
MAEASSTRSSASRPRAPTRSGRTWFVEVGPIHERMGTRREGLPTDLRNLAKDLLGERQFIQLVKLIYHVLGSAHWSRKTYATIAGSHPIGVSAHSATAGLPARATKSPVGVDGASTPTGLSDATNASTD